MSPRRRIGRSRGPLTLEALEERTLLSISVDLTVSGALTITGDNANNRITIPRPERHCQSPAPASLPSRMRKN